MDRNVFTRNCTQQDLWLAELCLLSGVDDVTHHRQLTASTQLKRQNVQHETHRTGSEEDFH